MSETTKTRIVTDFDIDPRGLGVWAVKAVWYGAERTVYTGTILGCIQHVKVEGWKYD